jgi:hypothetical protein
MAGIDAFAPGKALWLGVLLAGVNPRNLLFGCRRGPLAEIRPSTTEVVVP